MRGITLTYIGAQLVDGNLRGDRYSDREEKISKISFRGELFASRVQIEWNSLGWLLWQRCSNLSARMAIVASDAVGRNLSGNSWSLPGGPSENLPRS